MELATECTSRTEAFTGQTDTNYLYSIIIGSGCHNATTFRVCAAGVCAMYPLESERPGTAQAERYSEMVHGISQIPEIVQSKLLQCSSNSQHVVRCQQRLCK